jgi:hypothetical protein
MSSLAVTRNHSLWDAVAVVLGLDKVTVLATDEDIRAAEREQWDDRTNYLAVAPEVVTGFRVGGLTCRLALDPFFLSVPRAGLQSAVHCLQGVLGELPMAGQHLLAKSQALRWARRWPAQHGGRLTRRAPCQG